jgi:hypothetical protein
MRLQRIAACSMLCLALPACTGSQGVAKADRALTSIKPQPSVESDVSAEEITGASAEPPGEDYAYALEEIDALRALYGANTRSIQLGAEIHHSAKSPWLRLFGRRLQLDSEYANRQLAKLPQFSQLPDPVPPLGASISSRASPSASSALDWALLTRAKAAQEDKLQIFRRVEASTAGHSALREHIKVFEPLMRQHSEALTSGPQKLRAENEPAEVSDERP